MRATLWAGCAVVVLAAAVGAGRLWAEGKDRKPAPRSRFAMVNVAYVVKNYEKYKTFQDDLKGTMKPFQDQDKKLRARGEKLAKELQDPTHLPAKKEEIGDKLRKLQRELEEVNLKAKKVLGKKSEDSMKTIFLDIQEAAQRYAAAHDLEVVMQYNDAPEEKDLLSPQNIARKLQLGGLTPLYTASGVDITREIVGLLNQRFRKD